MKYTVVSCHEGRPRVITVEANDPMSAGKIGIWHNMDRSERKFQGRTIGFCGEDWMDIDNVSLEGFAFNGIYLCAVIPGQVEVHAPTEKQLGF